MTQFGSTMDRSSLRRFVKGHSVNSTDPFVAIKKEETEQSISARFEQQVVKYHDCIAVNSNLYQFSYSQLNSLANRIARAILTQRGEGQEPVAVLLGDDVPKVAAILGALKADKIYIPMDPTFPPTALSAVLDDSQASVILTDSSNLSSAQELTNSGTPVININELDGRLSAENLDSLISPDSLAYILYTSGSTGKPKGVFQNHRNVLHKVRNYTNSSRITAADRLALIVPFAFSAAVPNLFGGLLNGATVCTFGIKAEGLTNLGEWLMQEEITIYQSAVTVFRYFAEALRGDEKFPRLRLIDVFGEPLSPADVKLYKAHFSRNCVLRNRLASTETGDICQYPVRSDSPMIKGSVPAGYVVDGVNILLLDENGRQVDLGETGEIAVKSAYLALGYWRDPDLTESVFLPDPDGKNERVFLTGDLGRMLPDGCLVHLGRKDTRLKIRGHRVEVAEVEMALLEHAAIKEAVVVAQDDLRDEKRLVAYVVPRTNGAVRTSALRVFVEEKLPEYMVPSFFVLLDILPVNSNGKVDRQALPLVACGKVDETTFVPPRTPLEAELAEIWSGILGVERVSMCDNFFDLGGHSLLAAQIVSRVRDIFQVDVPVVALLENPTVGDLATAVAVQQAEQAGGETLDELLAELEQISDEDAQMMSGKEAKPK